MKGMNRLLLLAIGLLVVGIAAIALVLLGSPPDLNARTADILLDLSSGEYEAVWEASSREFQERYPRQRFKTLMGDFHGQMGAYRRILKSADGTAPQAGGAGGVEGLSFELEYAEGTAFCFIVLDDEAAPPQLRELLLRKTP